MRGWLATVPAQGLNVTLRNDHGTSGGEAAVPWQDRQNLAMDQSEMRAEPFDKLMGTS